MDLRQLEIAVAIIDQGGISRAATALGITQPSVSQSLHKLEAELGVALFRRSGRTVGLTDAGRAFEGPARAVLRGVTTLEVTVAAHRELTAGVLRIGTLPTLAASVAAGVIATFRQRHPAVTVQIADERRPPRLLDMVADGRCELAFSEYATRRPGLVSVPLGRQELVAVLPPDATVPATGGLSLAALAALPMVLAPPGTSIREQFGAACEQLGLTPWVAVEVPQREAIVPLVVAGAGATVAPPEQAREAAAAGARVISLDPPMWRELSLIHPDRDPSPAAAAMLAIARQATSAAVAADPGRAQPIAASAPS